MSEQQEKVEAPEDRAESAARDLADRGIAVTARAVRDAAGVRMTVAADAARAWREAAAERSEVTVPDVPEDVQGRMAAIWSDAYRSAHSLLSPERDQLASEVEQLRGEVDGLTTAVADVEAERDEHAERAVVAEQAGEAKRVEAEQAVARATRAEEHVVAVEAERDRLAAQIAALIERIPSISEGSRGDREA